jgi:integrase
VPYDYIVKTQRFEGKRYKARGKTEREAYQKLAAMIEAAKRGEGTTSGNMTVNAWYKQWMETYKEPKDMTGKSLGMYDEKYNKYIKPRIGSMKLKDVKDVHLQKILNEQAGMSESHVKKVRSVLQQMFKRARQSRLIVYDPAELLELPKYTKGTRRSLTEEERKVVLKVAETHRGGLLILTLLYTGMRPAEAVALSWDDVDLDKKEIHVRAAKESGTHNKIKAPKTEAGTRVIPIHSKLLPLLTKAPRSKCGRVFVNEAGNPHNENSLRRLWENFKREMDIAMGAKLYRSEIVESVLAPDLVLYCLRHTFCTDLQNAGVPLNVAKDLMGHADIQTTANIYTHRDSNLLRQGIALLDGSANQ